MNLAQLILFTIIIEFHPGNLDRETWEMWFTTYDGGWDQRFWNSRRPAYSGRGGIPYGMIGGDGDPKWLGNSDFLDNDHRSIWLDARRTYTGYEYWPFLVQKTHSILTVTPIMYKDKPLYGWFHLKLVANDASMPESTKVSLEQVYAHVETENDFYAPAGSFVRTKFTKAGCATVNADDKYYYKPSTYAQDPFIQAHNTFLRRLPRDKGVPTYEWNVRIDFPLCRIFRSDNALYFRILMTEFTYQGFSLPHQKWIYLKDHVYGAADPEPPSDAAVDCTKEDATVPWIAKRGELLQNMSWWRHDCTPEALTPGGGIRAQYTWGGRCCIGFSEPYSQKSPYLLPRVTHKYHCRRQSSSRKFLFKTGVQINYTAPQEEWDYPEINDYEKQALGAATIKCESKQCKETVVNQTNEGVSAKSVIGRYIFAGRQGHGILMVIACLFVYPLTNFVSRYFKGTFMTTRYIANIHAWYAVHIYGTLTTLTLLLTGVGMGIYAREYLGHSFHVAGRAHVAFGYITVVLFLGGIISNALRCGKKASGNCSIILHACFGVFFYYLALATVALSVWIPGSPGGHKHKRATLLDNIANSALVVVTLLFPMFEIVVHVFGTIQMCKRDVRFGVLRDWACFVAIPRVAAGEENDEAGTGLKSILFVVYLLGASVATIIALVTIGTSDPDGHFFDKMTYTHVNGKLSTKNIEKHEEAEDVLL